MPAAAICGRCDRLHVDRDVDAELHPVCAELMVVGGAAVQLLLHVAAPVADAQ